MKSLAVVTLTFNHHWQIGKYTHPLLAAYADRIGASFVIIKDRRYPNFFPQYEKFQLADLLSTYQRICYIDTDAIVRATTPNLFDRVPDDQFGIVDERHYPKEAKIWTPEKITTQYSPYGHVPQKEYNTGVMVISQSHKAVFQNPLILNKPYYDQPWINIQLEKLKIKICELGREYNYSPLHVIPDADLKKKLHILHYAGDDSRKLPAIKQELGIA